MAGERLRAQILAQMNGSPCKLADIARSVGRGPKDGAVRAALSTLVDDGELVRAGGAYLRAIPAAPDAESELASLLPEVPAGLHAAGRQVWAAAWSVSWTTELDRGAILHLARLEDEAAALCAVLDTDGLTQKRPVITPRGDVVAEEFVSHPALADLRKLDKPIGELRKVLGLDPESRARLQLEAAEGPDALDLIKQKHERRLRGEDHSDLDRRVREHIEHTRLHPQRGSAEGRRRR
jgi:P27 family predicted phage terminase small subunit